MHRKKKILGVGNDPTDICAIAGYLSLLDGEMYLHRIADNVTEAITEIKRGHYSGVYINSLCLPLGFESKKYSKESRKFEGFDSPPFFWYSGGLRVVEFAGESGLVTVVDGSGERNESVEARRLGAVIIESPSAAKKVIDAFRERL